MMQYGMYDGYFYFSYPQYISVTAAGIFSCTLSFFGSCTILFLIWKSQHRIQEVYHRLVLGMSISDLLVTFGLLLQPFLFPSETGYPFAMGNQTTCNLMGFIAPFFATSYCYSCFLGVYFMMMVRQNRKEKEIASILEPWVHVLAWGFPLIYAIVCVSLDLINPNPYLAICNTIPYPIECTFLDDVDCIRAEMASNIVPIHDAISLLYVLVGMVSTWLVYWTVRQQSRTMARYSVDGAINENQQKRERAVAVQAICFAGAYLIGFVTVLSVEVLKAIVTPRLEGIGDLEDYPFFFVVVFLIWLFFPMQGFFNCLIYIRPRYMRWRNYFPEKSWVWCLRMVVTGQTSPPGGWNSVAVNNSTRLVNRSSRDFTSPPRDTSGTGPIRPSTNTSCNLSMASSVIDESKNQGKPSLDVLDMNRTPSTLSPLEFSSSSERLSLAEEKYHEMEGHEQDAEYCPMGQSLGNKTTESVTSQDNKTMEDEGGSTGQELYNICISPSKRSPRKGVNRSLARVTFDGSIVPSEETGTVSAG